jgi:hypothetical protein
VTVDAYLAAVVARLRSLLGDRLTGVYPAGSLAFDAYRTGRSDVDLIAVADRPTPAELATIVASLSHDALPCPAAGLELVLYDRTTLAGLRTEAGFALNLNTGRELTAKAETSAGDGLTFWYPIDRDMACQQRRTLTGPPFTSLTTRQPYDVLLPVVADSVAAQLAGLTDHGDNAVLNGCRALRYQAGRTWSAKPAAASWALSAAPGFAPVIAAALNSHARNRAAGRHVDIGAARAFLSHVHATLTNRR